ncbi:succinate dehydrogenase, subunit D [Calliopsis andreniformis]|uniref:succinate dehydrogenase, subunit D n=1 Tax=Calliopsis andreniformis TaxID=337506 RepID=UPI003FCD5940
MIFERMSANMFRKVRQLESLSKTTFLSNTRTSTSLASINRCLNSTVTNSGNNRFLTKFPPTTLIGTQSNRNSTTTTGDHVRVWVMEKVVSLALPCVLPVAFTAQNQLLDGLLSVLVVMHTHWGLEAIITDYARPSVVGNILPKMLHLTLLLLSATTLAGLFLLIHDGPGVTKAVINLWRAGKQKEVPQEEADQPAK